MFKKIVYKWLKHRHFWRNKDFDELSELYITSFFRGLSISITGLFIPVYMIRLHYSILSILIMVAWYFTIRAVAVDIITGYTVAKIGPKHSLLIGFLLLTISSGLFLTLPHHHWPLWLLGSVWGSSYSFFFIPFNVSFSKVKHEKHGGRELGYTYIMTQLGAAAGPLIGALVATIFGARFIFLAAAILLLIGAIPLFLSAEPVKINQKLDFTKIKADGLIRDYFSFCVLGMENTICLVMWPLYLGLFVLIGSSVYAKLGIMSSATVIVSIIASYSFGRLIDHNKGRQMLRTTTILNAFLHTLRPLVQSYFAAFLVNFSNEAITQGYRLPYFKAMYDAADDLPGHRIVYVTSMEMLASSAKATMWWIFVLIAGIISARSVTTVGFMVAAAASLLIMTERFKSLNIRSI